MYVRKDYDPYTFALVPYSNIIYEDGADCGYGCAPLQLVITPERETSTVLTYWIKNKQTPKQFILGAQQAPVLVPFWVLANAAVLRQKAGGAEPSNAAQLVYTTGSVLIPSVHSMARGIRKGCQSNITARVLYAANAVKLTKGDRICLSEGPPSEMPAATPT